MPTGVSCNKGYDGESGGTCSRTRNNRMNEPLRNQAEVENSDNAVEAAPVARPVSRVAVGIAYAVTMGLFLGLDFAIGRQGWPMHVLQSATGGAQLCLIAVCVSLAPGNIVIRISWSLLLGAAMWYASMWGARTGGWIYSSEGITLGVLLLVGIVVLQIPLWIAKKVFRWQLIGRSTNPALLAQEDRQFEIRHMLLATFLLAAALAPLRSVLPMGGTFEMRSWELVDFGTVIFCNLAATIPCIWWAFLSTAKAIWVAPLWLIYVAAVTAAVAAVDVWIYHQIFRPWHGNSAEFSLGIFVLDLSQCFTVFVVLRVFRALGFRLVRMPRLNCTSHPNPLPEGRGDPFADTFGDDPS
jgi:hypothetical protein